MLLTLFLSCLRSTVRIPHFKQGDAETSLICSGSNEFEFSCVSNPIPAFHLLIVPATGKMGVSFLYGAIDEAVEKSTISAAAFNCTKF